MIWTHFGMSDQLARMATQIVKWLALRANQIQFLILHSVQLTWLSCHLMCATVHNESGVSIEYWSTHSLTSLSVHCRSWMARMTPSGSHNHQFFNTMFHTEGGISHPKFTFPHLKLGRLCDIHRCRNMFLLVGADCIHGKWSSRLLC